MAIYKEALKHFYLISPYWNLTDQRFLSSIGLELECVEFSFSQLIQICVENTDPSSDEWKPEPDVLSRVMTHCFSFVDHCSRLQKLIRGFVQRDHKIISMAEAFFDENEELFAIRRAINHSYSRIDSDDKFDHIQPIGGDFSWQTAHADISALDTYIMSFGPMAGGELATPAISTMTSFNGKVGELYLDNLRFRIHGHEASLTSAFISLQRMIENLHSLISERYEKQIAAQEIEDPLQSGEYMPSGFSSRLRMSDMNFNFEGRNDD